MTNCTNISASTAIGRPLFPHEAALFDDDCLCDQLKNDAAHEGCFPSDFPSFFLRDNGKVVFRHFGDE